MEQNRSVLFTTHLIKRIHNINRMQRKKNEQSAKLKDVGTQNVQRENYESAALLAPGLVA